MINLLNYDNLCSFNRTGIAFFDNPSILKRLFLVFWKCKTFILIPDEYLWQSGFFRQHDKKMENFLIEFFALASNPFCNNLYIYIYIFLLFLERPGTLDISAFLAFNAYIFGVKAYIFGV